MELKTKYQYSYFIYPYIIKENKYERYLLKLLKDRKIKVRFMQKEKDLELYTYFLPAIRKFMFQDFEYTQEKIRKFKEFDKKMQATILAKKDCTILEYNIEQGVQGKSGEKEGIFFKVSKIEIICFKTGICFLCMKTNVEDSNKFSDVQDFNYKFKDINSENINNLKKYENIRLQNHTFSDVKGLGDLIKEITGARLENKQLNLETNRFFTHCYTCIEQEGENDENEFEKMEFEFLKYVNIVPSSYKLAFKHKENQILSNSKFVKIGFSKLGTTLLTTGRDTYNYTKLPDTFEKEYLYTYLLNLYKKIYLNKIENEFKNPLKIKAARKKFVEFTKNIWIQDITNDDEGSQINEKYKTTLELDKIYHNIKSKYDLAYKELNIQKTSQINKYILILLVLSLLLNVLNFVVLMKMSH